MRRETIVPRVDWRQKLLDLGMDGLDECAETYWTEDACYVFSEAEVECIDDCATQLESMMAAAVEHVVANDLFGALGISPSLARLAAESWQRGDYSLYGRYDLQFDGAGPPKLLEYNADTPTALYEASVIQWHWLEDCYPLADQFNSIHEKLLDAVKTWRSRLSTDLIHFSCVYDDDDDLRTTSYLKEISDRVGAKTQILQIQDIGWNGSTFRDLQNREINAIFKLYPWEWLAEEQFFEHLVTAKIAVVEPAWRIIASSKGILPVLWQLFPDHPNLLPATFDVGGLAGPHVVKPVFGREGSNIQLSGSASGVSTGGGYDGSPCIAQKLAPLPCFEGRYPVIGLWVAGGKPGGIGIREDCSPITSRTAHFVPHRIED